MLAQAGFLVSAGLLVVSGVAKVVDPVPTVGALRAARLPHGRSAAIALGVVEAVVAAWAFLLGGPAVVGVAVLYGAFAVFVAAALRLDLPIGSCGCFGAAETPPTWLHFAYNVIAVFAAVIVAISGFAGVGGVVDGPVGAAMIVGYMSLGVFASYLMLSELPRVLAVARST